MSPTPGPGDESSETATFADTVGSLRVLRAYLETSGCRNYERFYELSDQMYELNKKESVQKTIKDFFHDFIVFTFSLLNDYYLLCSVLKCVRACFCVHM